MSDEWKRFLRQWILPVGIFGIVIAFVFAGFSANIRDRAISECEENMVASTQNYATAVASSVMQAEAVTSAVAGIIQERALDGEDAAASLASIVSNSSVYKAILCDPEGNTVSDTGDEANIYGYGYCDEIFNADSFTYHYVANDGFAGYPALVISKDVNYEAGLKKLMAFVPANVATIKNIVTVEKDLDPLAYSVVTNMDGTVIVSTNMDSYKVGDSIWKVLEENHNNSSTLLRMKTKAQAGNTGNFNAVVNNNNYLVTFAPVKGTSQVLTIQYTSELIDKEVSVVYDAYMRKLYGIGIVVLIFVLVVTILNIVQIYATTKNTADLKDKADTDQLTGLKNKLATEREIKEYIEEHPDALAMMFIIDIDNFKKINDTMGHAFGDEVLRELGRHIGINFRVSDIIGRTGGDEFTVFLKNLKEDTNTLREAQKLVYFFRHFQVGDYVKYSVTASIGAAVFPAHGSNFETLYKAADAAVYKSKKRGKNQLSFYDDRDRTPEEVAEADSHLIDIERKEETPIEN